MICHTCRAAGKLYADGDYTGARALHEQCEYPRQCGCHHYTGPDPIIWDGSFKIITR